MRREEQCVAGSDPACLASHDIVRAAADAQVEHIPGLDVIRLTPRRPARHPRRAVDVTGHTLEQAFGWVALAVDIELHYPLPENLPGRLAAGSRQRFHLSCQNVQHVVRPLRYGGSSPIPGRYGLLETVSRSTPIRHDKATVSAYGKPRVAWLVTFARTVV